MTSSKDTEIMHRLIRDIEDVYGASYTSLMALDFFIESLKRLKCEKSQLKAAMLELADAIRSSEPSIVPLGHLLLYFEAEMEREKGFERPSAEGVIATAIGVLLRLIERQSLMSRKIVGYGVAHIENGDVIIVHSVSPYLRDMLLEARRRGRDFRILILKQDFVKTRQVIRYMDEGDVAYVVVPEYNLAHFMGEATKLFLGAVSVTEDNKMVTATGTAGIVSLSHLNGLPVYLFVNSLKFSHKKCADQNIHLKKEEKIEEDVRYLQISHSHDVVDIHLVDHLIIEAGEIQVSDIPRFRCSV